MSFTYTYFCPFTESKNRICAQCIDWIRQDAFCVKSWRTIDIICQSSSNTEGPAEDLKAFCVALESRAAISAVPWPLVWSIHRIILYCTTKITDFDVGQTRQFSRESSAQGFSSPILEFFQFSKLPSWKFMGKYPDFRKKNIQNHTTILK